MRTDLNFRVVHRGRGDGAAAFVNGLLDERAFGIRKELVIPDGEHVGFDDLHAGIAPHDGVRAKQQVELLFERNREGIDLK